MPGIITAILIGLATPAPAQTPANPVALSVVVLGNLPGFRADAAAAYVAQALAAAGLPDWRFGPGNSRAVPDRIEWDVSLDPYAASGVRQFIPMPQMQKLFGNRHRITVEMRLYMGGEYQTLMFGQTVIRGGGADDELAAFIVQMANGLLGPHGAYRSIDLGPP